MLFSDFQNVFFIRNGLFVVGPSRSWTREVVNSQRLIGKKALHTVFWWFFAEKWNQLMKVYHFKKWSSLYLVTAPMDSPLRDNQRKICFNRFFFFIYHLQSGKRAWWKNKEESKQDGFQNGKFVRKWELNFSVWAGSFLSISRGETCKSERLLFYTQETLVVKSRIVSCYIIYVKLVQI